MRGKLVRGKLVRVRVWRWVRVMVEFGTFSAFRGWVRVLGYGFGVRGRKVKPSDCALASDLVRAQAKTNAGSFLPLVGTWDKSRLLFHLAGVGML